MSDSNPRSGDWDNTMRGWLVFAAMAIFGVFLFVLFVTGHAKAAIVIIIMLCLAALVTKWIQAGRHERDH